MTFHRLPPLPRSLHALVVDEDQAQYDLLHEMLTQIGAHDVSVSRAVTYGAAVERLRDGTFDILLVASALHGTSGVDLVRTARHNGVTTPAIVLSDSEAWPPGADMGLTAIEVIDRRDLSPALLDRSIRHSLTQVHAEKAVRSIGTFTYSVLDALESHIVVLDADGAVLEVNRAWRQFVAAYGLPLPDDGVGTPYLDAFHAAFAVQGQEQDTTALAAALRAMLDGQLDTYALECVCRQPANGAALAPDCWYAVTLSRLVDSNPASIVITHEDVTERHQAHADRQRVETQYRSLVERAPAAIFTESLDGDLLYMSPRIEAITGYPAAAWLGDIAFRAQVTHPDDWAGFVAANAVADASGTPFEHEYRIIRPDGDVIWVRDEATLVRSASGDPAFWQGFLTDITTQRQAQADLVEREARFRALVRNVLDLVAIVDADGVPTYESPAVARTLGYDEGDMHTVPLGSRVHVDDRDAVAASFARVRAQPNSSDSVTFRAIHRDGSQRVISAIFSNMLQDPAVQGIVLSARDITERVEMERQRVEVENRYRSLVEQMPAMLDIGAIDLTSSPTYVSPQVLDMYGYTQEEWLADGNLWLTSIHPDDLPRVTEEHLRTNASGERFTADYRIVTRSGAIRYIRDEAFLVHDADGQPLHWQGLKFDITDSTLTARALEALNHEYQQLVETAQDGIVSVDRDGRITFANAAYGALVGRPARDVIGEFTAAVVHPDDLPMVLAFREELRSGAGHVVRTEYRIVRDDGTVRMVDANINPRVEHGVYAGSQAILRDITDRVDAVRALRASERRLRDVIENIPAVTYTYTVDDDINEADIHFGARISQVLGVGPEGVRTWSQWLGLIHPDDRAYVDTEAQRTDRTGDPFDITFRVRSASGEWRWVHDVAIRMRDVDDGPGVWQGFFFDITKQTVLEERTNLTLRGALDAIITITADGTVIDWNPAATSIFGHEQEDVLDRKIDELIIPEHLRDAHRAGLRRVTESGEERILGRRLEMTAVRANGDEFPIELSITRMSSDGHPVFTAFLRDISERRIAEATIREAEERYRMLVEQIVGAVYLHVHDPDAESLYMSPQITMITGYDVSSWEDDHDFWTTIVHPDDLHGVYQDALDVLNLHDKATAEYRVVRADGRIIWVRDMAARVPATSAVSDAFQGLIVDITDEKQAELLARESEARYLTLIQSLPNSAILLFDHDLRYLVAEGAALDALGIGERQIIGRTLEESVSAAAYAQLLPHYLAAIQGHGNQTEMVIRGRDVLIDIVPVHDQGGEVMAGMVMAVDITERKRLERQITHQSLHDSLTGLPNRALLLDRLDQALVLARRRDLTVAALFIDIDDFKVVNDTMGHASGDHLLQLVADRFRVCLHEEDAVTRFGGDEFVVVLSDVDGPMGALTVAQRLLDSLQHPIDLGGQELHLSCSIGIALSQSGEVDRSDLLRHADIALYRVKAAGKHGLELFDQGMHEATVTRLELERDLRGALSRGEFHLVYQPIVDLADGKANSMEALLRWTHPVRGPISPVDFIPIAEATGQIVEIGDWVLAEACQQLARWREHGHLPDPLRMNVNLSARQFHRTDLPERIRAVLTECNLPPELFTIELTESDVMADPQDAVRRLREIKQLGVRIAIDDFGTGYSSLAYLHEFPADVIKIDRTFIQRIDGSPDGTPIVAATIMLAHTLGLHVVAEGIETREQLDVLRDLGCERGQGFFFSRPLPASAIAWVDGNMRRTPSDAPSEYPNVPR